MQTRPSWIDTSLTFLISEVGSTLYGAGTSGTDDLDQMGICVEPLSEAVKVGSKPFEHYIYRTAWERTGKIDAPSMPGDLDLTIYSLQKWMGLAVKGNPSILLLLYAPEAKLVKCTTMGEDLRRLAPHFATQQTGKAFLGYLIAQKERLMGERGQKNVNRRELVEKYGYDTKYAAHIIRLGLQGKEMMETGRLQLPCSFAPMLLDIRQGKWSLPQVIQAAQTCEEDLRAAIDASDFPLEPDFPLLNEWMQDTYRFYWSHF